MEMNGESGAQQVKKNAVLGLKEKRIEDHKRSTTPYMTKYERARVLGTRALQIRYGAPCAQKARKRNKTQDTVEDDRLDSVADLIWYVA